MASLSGAVKFSHSEAARDILPKSVLSHSSNWKRQLTLKGSSGARLQTYRDDSSLGESPTCHGRTPLTVSKLTAAELVFKDNNGKERTLVQVKEKK